MKHHSALHLKKNKEKSDYIHLWLTIEMKEKKKTQQHAGRATRSNLYDTRYFLKRKQHDPIFSHIFEHP